MKKKVLLDTHVPNCDENSSYTLYIRLQSAILSNNYACVCSTGAVQQQLKTTE